MKTIGSLPSPEAPVFVGRFLTRVLFGMSIVAVGSTPGCGREGQGGFSPPPMPVEIARVTEQAVADRFEAVGTIDAGEAITVVSEIGAQVIRLPFAEGKQIAKGGLIAQLDDTQLKAEVQRTEAVREQQQITFDRTKAIVERGAGAPQELDNAAAGLKIAEAELAVAKARLAKARIVAPFDGVLGARRVSPGAYLRPGDPITDLAQLRRIKVTFSVPERYLSLLGPGTSVTISTPAFPGVELHGKVDVVDPVLDPNTRTTKIIARVDNPEGRFRPGMSTDVSAILSERPHALTIPNEAVFAEGNQSLVYAVGPDSTVTRKSLTLGTRLPDVVEVVEGLSPGMQVVRAGHQKLFEGAKVLPITSQAPPGTQATPDTSQTRSP
jgi:membrane fusion protein (multidrug efflux system)